MEMIGELGDGRAPITVSVARVIEQRVGNIFD